MAIWIGTSGYNYPEWRGSFYPEGLPAARMLPHYSSIFSTVEINYTFYHAPTPKVLTGWSDATPERFRLTLKAPRRITHDARLRDCAQPLSHFIETATGLGNKLGCLLFQLPPYLRCDVALLGSFLDAFPAGVRAALEVRHTSWFAEEVYQLLAARGLALCIADSEKLSTPVIITAPHAYFRLRDEGYSREDVVRWARQIRARTAGCEDVYVYFKHEEHGKGPVFAHWLTEALEERI
jgi:uncharacterized protein YecE (DUF72 family)